MDCTICNEVREVARIQLLCGHSFHTDCWLRNNGMHGGLAGIRCNDCHTFIIPDEIHNEIQNGEDDNSKDSIIKFLWETNDDFKANLFELFNIIKTQNKSLSFLNKRAEILNLNSELLECKNKLKLTLAELNKEYKKTEEYKYSVKIGRTYNKKMNDFLRTWGCNLWEIKTALRDITGNRNIANNILNLRFGPYKLNRLKNKFKYYRIRI